MLRAPLGLSNRMGASISRSYQIIYLIEYIKSRCRILYMNWLCFITSLPTENATLRQRSWRALKACGSAVLRDGVYLLPDQGSHKSVLEAIAQDVLDGGGTALVLITVEPAGQNFKLLFDRKGEYVALLDQVTKAGAGLTDTSIHDALKQARKLRKAFTQLCDIDFFPGEAQSQLNSALNDLEQTCAYALSPHEPRKNSGSIAELDIKDYQGRLWATRARPWVDRLASAWLIRRFIDTTATITWLNNPEDCPQKALGFDFDGATFSHVGSRVTFEVLAASFGLTSPAMVRLGLLIHYLDVGGVQPAEASGIESLLQGLRQTIEDDDQLLATASTVFDGLLCAFQQSEKAT